MSNQSRYRAMMDDIHAPAEVLARVKGIPMEKTKKHPLALKYATAACAALLGVFVVTNGVCYAATGETWVEKATVWVNGEPMEVDVQMVQNGDVTIGTMEYTVEDGEGGEIGIEMTAEGGSIEDATFEINDYAKGDYKVHDAGVDCQVLESADGRVSLVAAGADPIDITDQVKQNGGATGTFEKDGATYVYKVAGEPGNWHVSVEAESNPAAER